MKHYRIYPGTVPADNESLISISPEGTYDIFEASEGLHLLYSPVEWHPESANGGLEQKVDITLKGERITFNLHFSSEQEHYFQLKNSRGQNVCTFSIYSLNPDLYGMLPLCGDHHMHSNRSDGLAPPGAMGVAAVDNGFDFISLTDHGLYAPSLKLKKIMRNSGSGLTICPGEEVHPPGNPVHIVNFGGKSSVNRLFHSEPEDYAGEVAQRVEKMELELSQELKIQLASAEWCFDKIREAGGTAILSHPYWKNHHNRFYMAEALISALLKRKKFDAMEILGGFMKSQSESNTLQLARYHEERAEGNQLPVVGAGDAHADTRKMLFGWYYTMVFCRNNSYECIAEGISDMRSVAIEDVPGESVRCHGPFRLVKYAMFLLREILPEYREIRKREAVLLRSYLRRGDASAEQVAQAAAVAAKYLARHGLTGIE